MKVYLNKQPLLQQMGEINTRIKARTKRNQ
ncbi:hypothetical protein J2Z72_000263 [Peptostreptococcus canis]|nr:hypothetical protein [Peptostreptococcus canis]